MGKKDWKKEIEFATEAYYGALDNLAGQAGQSREEWVATVDAALAEYPDYDETTLDWDE